MLRISDDDFVVQENGCWLWVRTKPAGNGYAEIRRGRGGRLGRAYAHRVSYEQAHGAIPEGHVIDHLCRTPLCINPEHLEAVTDAVNIRRGEAPAAINAAKTHCLRGHPLSGDNVRMSDGRRICRACERQRAGQKAA